MLLQQSVGCEAKLAGTIDDRLLLAHVLSDHLQKDFWLEQFSKPAAEDPVDLKRVTAAALDQLDIDNSEVFKQERKEYIISPQEKFEVLQRRRNKEEQLKDVSESLSSSEQ